MIGSDDRSFRFGDGLFETVLVDDRGAFALERHRGRFERSARFLGLGDQQIAAGLEAIDALADAPPGVWRVTVSRDGAGVPFGGSGTIDVSRRDRTERDRPRLVAAEGFWVPDDRFAEHKTTSWIRNIEARRRATSAGADDAVLCSVDGRIGEASSSNVFVCRDGRVATAPLRGLLPGTARARVLVVAEDLGIEIVERGVTVADLAAADEIVLTNASVLALSAASWGGRPLEADLGPKFRAALERLR